MFPDLIHRYVVTDEHPARYLRLRHGPPAGDPVLLAALRHDATHIPDDALGTLLTSGNWRNSLVAAFLAGAGRRTRWHPVIAAMLSANRSPYGGAAYCFALAAFADTATLTAYLDHNLAHSGHGRDEGWALGALLHLDPARAASYLAPDGPWQQWLTRTRHRPLPDPHADHMVLTAALTHLLNTPAT